MRLPASTVSGFYIVGTALALTGCADFTPNAAISAPEASTNGPAADYPVIIGDPFTIEGVTYTPGDTLNYDRVGYLAIEDDAGSGVTAAHRTLPLPSYAEITALDSGRTILVRIERRGPMRNDRLIALSSDAAVQLGSGEGTAIRMRRVNPPEEHRAELRADNPAPLRMDTPPGLLEVLKRRLPDKGSASLGDPRQEQVSGAVPKAGAITATATPTVPIEQPAKEGNFVVQIGAFAVRENADRLADKVGGFIDTSGSLALVRTGPYLTRGQAEEALAKLKAAGYSDARLRTLD